MKQQFISNNNEPNLLLIFSGWGTHAELFSPYSIRQTDICVCYDYREDTFDCTPFLRYKQISVIGWSFGVWMAAYTLSKTPLKSNKNIAVNGTMRPIDDTYGIPKAIFTATLDSLTETSFSKFQRRICGNAKRYDQFHEILLRREMQEVSDELTTLRNRVKIHPNISFCWDEAYIADRDLIFSADRQRDFWKQHSSARIKEIEDFHLPNFKSIFDELYSR